MIASAVVLGLLLGSDPFVAEVPPGGSLLDTSAAHPKGDGALFRAAPLTLRGGRLVAGAWASSDDLLDETPTRVVIAATWCPACRRLFERLAAAPERRTVVLLLDDEHARRAGRVARSDRRVLERPELLAEYRLEFHLMDARSPLAERITGYPTTFTCTRSRCRRGWPDARE